MTDEELLSLLAQQEGPTLEFKRDVPNLDDAVQHDEMVKDVLALVNGNVSVVGQQAHLIWGADSAVDALGQRTRYDVGDAIDAPALRDRIAQIMRSACNPPISDLQCEVVALQDARLVVLTIPPSQHVHETTRELTVKAKNKKRDKPYTKVYTKHTVFMRVGATIDIASAADRDVLRERKQWHFNEPNKVRPVLFGAALGGIVGVSVARGIVNTPPEQRLSPNMTTAIMGVLIGGGLGAVTGMTYKQGAEFWRQVQAMEHIPSRWRKPVFVGITGVLLAIAYWVDKLIPIKGE